VNHPPSASQSRISEIFSSLQGEGTHLGERHLFIRFEECHIHCGYCDELAKMKEGAFEIYSLEKTLSIVDVFEEQKGPHHSISLTGGEPLFYTSFLKEFLPELKKKGLTTYLETNGTLPGPLASIIKWCDIIAMDLKPPSSTGDRAFFSEHAAFLKIASTKEVFVKVVVTPSTKLEEIHECIRLVAEAGPKTPFIFQPLSDPIGINSESLKLIETSLFAMAKESLFDVRVIPQMHKIWGVR